MCEFLQTLIIIINLPTFLMGGFNYLEESNCQQCVHVHETLLWNGMIPGLDHKLLEHSHHKVKCEIQRASLIGKLQRKEKCAALEGDQRQEQLLERMLQHTRNMFFILFMHG